MTWRAALAFVIAPALVPASAYLRALVLFTQEQFDRVAIMYSLLFAVSYGLAVLVGMPLYRYMERRDRRLLRHYLTAGAIIGAIPGLALCVSILPTGTVRILIPLLTGSLLGALSAAVFWLIAFPVVAAASNKTTTPAGS